MIKAAAIRMGGYAVSSAAASVFYIGWIIVEAGGPGSFQTRLIAALIFYMFRGLFSGAGADDFAVGRGRVDIPQGASVRGTVLRLFRRIVDASCRLCSIFGITKTHIR